MVSTMKGKPSNREDSCGKTRAILWKEMTTKQRSKGYERTSHAMKGGLGWGRTFQKKEETEKGPRAGENGPA
jgi:hypothetical protein